MDNAWCGDGEEKTGRGSEEGLKGGYGDRRERGGV